MHIYVEESPRAGENIEFIAHRDRPDNRIGRASLYIFKLPDRIHLSRIDSDIPRMEIGTVLLLAVARFGTDNFIKLLDGQFEPDLRVNKPRRHLSNWYEARAVHVSYDGHDLNGECNQIQTACTNILVANSVSYSIRYL